jgi:hypothetical protein
MGLSAVSICDISPYGDAIYLLRKSDIRFTPFARDMICIPCHVPQAHIAPKVYRFPEGYIAHSGRNAYRRRAFSATNSQFEPLIRLPKLCFPLPHILYPLPKYTEKVNKSEKICKKVLDK